MTRSANQSAQSEDDALFDQRRDALIARLPTRIARAAHWLLASRRKWVRIPAGCLFLLGGCLWLLPILGLWMLPLGVALLAEDVPLFRRLGARLLDWVARRRPGWLHPVPTEAPQADIGARDG